MTIICITSKKVNTKTKINEIIGKFSAVEKEAMEHLSDEQWEQLIEMAETYEQHFTAGVTRLMQAAEEK